jgi:hypothetical protein
MTIWDVWLWPTVACLVSCERDYDGVVVAGRHGGRYVGEGYAGIETV